MTPGQQAYEADVARVPEDDGILRSKARALAESVWIEHRGTALRFNALSIETADILIDCCLKGMCVGIIGGSSLVRDEPAQRSWERGAGEEK